MFLSSVAVNEMMASLPRHHTTTENGNGKSISLAVNYILTKRLHLSRKFIFTDRNKNPLTIERVYNVSMSTFLLRYISKILRRLTILLAINASISNQMFYLLYHPFP